MALKVHGYPLSPPVQRVLLTLTEKDLQFEFILVDLFTRQNKKETFISSLHPFGQVPAFEDDDLKLFESRAINKYISHKYIDNGTQLLHKDPKKNAIISVWLEVEALRFDAAGQKLNFEILVKPLMGKITDEAYVEQLSAQLAIVLDVYEVQLAKSKYLAGDEYSLADLHHIPIIHNLMKTKVKALFDERPHVSAWVVDLLGRPAWEKVRSKFNI